MMEKRRTEQPLATYREVRGQLVQVEQILHFLADSSSLARRMACFNEHDAFTQSLDLLFRVVDALGQLGQERLRTIGGSLTDDLPF